ncbi:MAG TPA: hypothetical protein GX396_10755 [Tissierellia bacterium]|nr:hypothetical protein [Tissierellia bacterium]
MNRIREGNKRALNIIWNASNDYSLDPEFKVFDENGEVDLYWNYIIGAAHRFYDYALLEKFFNYLKIDRDHEFYEKLFWLGLENCIFNKGKEERPVLYNLRRNYGEKVLRGEIEAFENSLLEELRKAHFKRALGIDPEVTGNLLNILNDLEFDSSLNTEEIINIMEGILKKYFRFNYGQYERNEVKESKDTSQKHHQKQVEYWEKKLSDDEMTAMKTLYLDSAETARDVYLERENEKIKKPLKKVSLLNKGDSERLYIRKYYGSSIFSRDKTLVLEGILCKDNHKNCYLHFTRGEFDKEFENDVNAVYYNNASLKQRERNLNHFKENYISYQNSILKLTNRIRNTMLAYFEPYWVKSNFGRLNIETVWRNVYINDNEIFNRLFNNDKGNISVDILLDASASQQERQEIIAAQGYIIAESFTRCGIPVRVYSFSSLRNFTVITLYRDYEEVDKNMEIFNYKTTGCNRDGLAIRTSLHLMEDTDYDNKILVILSDCKPNDAQCTPDTGIKQEQTKYAGAIGIIDTAKEVKKGIQKGNSILCVFTGEDEDITTAKKIYGHSFARIHNPDRFAQVVGVLMQNQLKNL